MSSTACWPSSFRDPAGRLVMEEDRGLRTVTPECAGDTLAFLDSPVAEKWTQSGRLIASEVVGTWKPGSSLQLAHRRVFFPSYSWEWTPAQLSAAAELTLDLCEDLVNTGWILKDATPSNVLFDGGKPVCVDLLSVERHDPENPIWLACGQFIRTFLLPLAACGSLGWPLAAMLGRRDGYEPEELFHLLGPAQRLLAPWRSLVTLPVWLGNRSNGRSLQSMRRPAPVAQAILRRTLHSLRRTLRKVTRTAGKSHWSTYQQTATHYSAKDWNSKRDFVSECLLAAGPRYVLDIGANTGFFSRVAAESGARVVAWDADVATTEQAWLHTREAQSDVLPLVADFARPTPAAGWNNAETLSLLARSRGRFDMVMMLAVLHHLLVQAQIPIEHVASLTRELTRGWLLIEWVGPEDEKFRTLSNGRDSLFSHLTEDWFIACFSRYFVPVRRTALANGRALHLFRIK